MAMGETKNGHLDRRAVLKVGVGGAAASVASDLWAKPVPQVPRRTLGKTGEQIPILLFGAAMKLDPRFDPKIAEAMRYGVNYIDAADCYGGGTCEPAVAAFHRRMKARKKLWITSKSDQHDPKGFERTLNASLKKLETDYVDMYYLHALQDAAHLSPKLFALVERLKKAKKIKYFGFSCHHENVVELMNRAAELPAVDSIMFRYNFRKYGDKALNQAIDRCKKANIGLIAMKTQGSEVSFADAWKKFEQTGRWTKHQAVLKAVWADERITAAVSHMDSFKKLKENIAAAVDRSKLTEHETEALRKYAEATRAAACDGCEHLCNPAVDGPVQIGKTLRYLMYHDLYGQPEEAHALFAQLPEAARALRHYDFAPARRACPHQVDIVALMRRAADVFAV